MSIALISTVFNEAKTIGRWIEAIRAQTPHPDKFIIVDGASKDNTVSLLEQGFADGGFTRPRIIVKRCNIAEGRNLAIRESSASIIASSDAGSVPDAKWLEKITTPLLENDAVDVVGGMSENLVLNDFQRKLARYIQPNADAASENIMPSSRNVAFRRKAWEAVGGYPEWLTLTAEDALFNYNLRAAKFKFYYQKSAIVHWESRTDMRAYLKMMYNYGYGSAEARLYTNLYLRWLLSTFVPPLVLLSAHPLQDAPFRYARNAATGFGWLAGLARGKKPPEGWQRINGAWLSPETIAFLRRTAT